MKVFRSVVFIAGTAFASCASIVSAQTPPEDAQALRAQIEHLRRDFETLKQQYGERLTALEDQLAAIQGGQPGTRPPGAAAPSPDAPRPPATPESPQTTAAAPSAPEPPPPSQQPPATGGAEAGSPQPTAQVPPGAEGTGGPSGQLPVYGAAVSSSKIFNPDVAVVGNFLGTAGTNEVNPSPALDMPEAEASFQAIVDPYARADFFMGFGEEGVELEEGFVTFPTLPGGLFVKAGRMRAAFGKVNTLHDHSLPWSDRPLVTNLLAGGEEGISDAGISAARLIPNPWLFLEATGQVFRGNSGEGLFASSRRGDLTYVGHLRAYQDLTENGNVDLGFSYAHGHNPSGVVDEVDVGRFRTNLFGIDATYRWRPLARSIYHSFIGRSEVIWSRRDQPGGVQSSRGFYVSGDYQFARRWFAGLRYDRSDHPDDASLLDSGQSVTITFWPSEFNQVRGQYRRTRYATGPTANEFLLQFQFSIGAHGAHPF